MTLAAPQGAQRRRKHRTGMERKVRLWTYDWCKPLRDCTFQLQPDNFFNSEMKWSCELNTVARSSMHQKATLTNGPSATALSEEAKGTTLRTLKSTWEKGPPCTITGHCTALQAWGGHPKVRDTLCLTSQGSRASHPANSWLTGQVRCPFTVGLTKDSLNTSRLRFSLKPLAL